MFFEGSKEVLTRLFEKQRLLAAHDERHSTIRPLLLILSGTMRGVYGGGQVIALEHFGLSEAFDTAVGISTGAPTAAYFLARQSVIGTSIYCEECTTRDFISFLPRVKVGADFVADILRGRQSNKRLDQEAIRASRTSFFVGATCAKTGDAILIDAKTATPDVVQAVRASIAIPGLTNGAVELDGKHYLDGVGAHPLPARLVLDRFQPTDLLVFANGTADEREGAVRRALWHLLTIKHPRAVRSAFTTRPDRFAEELQHLRTQTSCRIGVIWSDGEVGTLERDPKKIVAARDRADKHLSGLLAEARDLS